MSEWDRFFLSASLGLEKQDINVNNNNTPETQVEAAMGPTVGGLIHELCFKLAPHVILLIV